jgi:hypothetical protein
MVRVHHGSFLKSAGAVGAQGKLGKQKGAHVMSEAKGEYARRDGWLPSPGWFFVVAAILIVLGASGVLSPLLTSLGALVAWRNRQHLVFWFGVAATILCLVLAVLISLY